MIAEICNSTEDDGYATCLLTEDPTAQAHLNIHFVSPASPWRIQDLPKGGGADHGERAESEPKRVSGGSGGGAPSGVQGALALVGGQGSKPL